MCPTNTLPLHRYAGLSPGWGAFNRFSLSKKALCSPWFSKLVDGSFPLHSRHRLQMKDGFSHLGGLPVRLVHNSAYRRHAADAECCVWAFQKRSATSRIRFFCPADITSPFETIACMARREEDIAISTAVARCADPVCVPLIHMLFGALLGDDGTEVARGAKWAIHKALRCLVFL